MLLNFFSPLLEIKGLHSASVPGILALDLSGDSSRALTGDVAHQIIVLFFILQL